jgi:uncharacterized membrane protein
VLGCGALLLMPVMLPLDGKVHGEWTQFLGRFHSVLVHLPIALILLVPVLEVFGRARPALREAPGFVLWLSVPACVFATLLGFLLAYGSGDAGDLVTRHMWGGIALTIAVVFCAVLRSTWVAGSARVVYPCLLGGVILLLVWATHQGGSITHGEGYLTEHAPAILRPRKPVLASPGSVYAVEIQPIFDAKCVSCHGTQKVKGRLRLDSLDRLMRGGQDGAAVIPGEAKNSLLFQRITLPAGDKKYMPSDGKPALTPGEIQMIKGWIDEGASPSAQAPVIPSK